MKIALAMLLLCAVAGSQVSLSDADEKYVIISKTFIINQAQYYPGMGMGMGMGGMGGMMTGVSPPFGGLSPATFFQVVVLQSEAEKLLSKPDLPEDLRQRALEVMANANEGFESCNTPTVLPWLQIRCASMQMSVVKNQLKAIDAEATARALAAATALNTMGTSVTV